MFKIFGPSQRKVIGVDISSGSVKIIEITSSGNEHIVEGFGYKNLPEDAMDGSVIKDIDAVSGCIRSILTENRLTSKKTVVAVPDSLAISHVIQAHEGMSEEEIEEMVVMEADKYIPYPIEEINLDFNILGTSAKNSAMVDVLIVASRSENVSNRVEAISRAGLEPDIVDVESFAIERVVPFACENMLDNTEGKLVAVIDIGAVYTRFYVLSGSKIIFTREEEFGGTQLIQSIMQTYGVKAEDAKKTYFNGTLPEGFEEAVIQPFKELILLQVKRGLQFFFSSTQFSQIDYILLAGGVARLPDIAKLVSEHVSVPTEVANPFREMKLAAKVSKDKIYADAPSLLVACGLALRASK